MNLLYIFAIILSLIITNIETSSNNIKIVKARLESCPGCSLNRLHDVKNFAYEDLPKYENVEFKKISGAPPELIFLGENDEEVERIALKTYTREECNNLLKSKGFVKNGGKEL